MNQNKMLEHQEVAPTNIRQEMNRNIALFLMEANELPKTFYWHELFTKASQGQEKPQLNQELDYLFGDHLHEVLDRFIDGGKIIGCHNLESLD